MLAYLSIASCKKRPLRATPARRHRCDGPERGLVTSRVTASLAQPGASRAASARGASFPAKPSATAPALTPARAGKPSARARPIRCTSVQLCCKKQHFALNSPAVPQSFPEKPPAPAPASAACRGFKLRDPLSIAQLRDLPCDLDFVLPGLLRGTVGALVSPGGVGKSYWTLALALSMSGSMSEPQSLVGLPLPRGKVVLFCAEDAPQVVAQRCRALLGQHESDFPDFTYHDCTGLDNDLMDASCFRALVAAGKGARLIVLDTLARFHTLDENSSQDARRLMARMEQLARETGASVLYLHHTSKVAATSGGGALQQAARGSSVLVDNARWAAFLTPMTQGQAKHFQLEGEAQQYIRWNVSKQNYGAALPDQWYRRRSDGVLVPVRLEPRHGSPGSQPREVAGSAGTGSAASGATDAAPQGPHHVASVPATFPASEHPRKGRARTFPASPGKSARGVQGGAW